MKQGGGADWKKRRKEQAKRHERTEATLCLPPDRDGTPELGPAGTQRSGLVAVTQRAASQSEVEEEEEAA